MTATNKGAGIDPELVRELAQILRDTDLAEIEVEQGDLKMRVSRHAPAAAPIYAPPLNVYPAPAPAPYAGAPAPIAPTAAAAPNAAKAGAVASPMVGTAYLSPEPGAPAFCKIGDMVSEGQTLLIVEAMKTMNPIPAPKSGKIMEICVADAQPVEFGQALIVLG